MRCSALQGVAVCCSGGVRGGGSGDVSRIAPQVTKFVKCLVQVSVCCSALQCVAVQVSVCCSALQCVAVRCSVLQCVARCCSWCVRGVGSGNASEILR